MNIKITDFEDSVYTGFLKYEDENYQFVFSGETLRMIPESTEKRNDMWKFGMKEIVQGTYTWGDPPRMEQDVIIGRCNETNQKIVFLPKKGSYIAHQNSVLLIALETYIICKYERDKIDRIAFTGPEINGIHPTSQAIEYTIVPDSFVNSGTFEVKTRDFDCTTTQKQEFTVDSKSVSVSFGVSRTMSTKNWEPPMKLSSNMLFELDATDDYRFILQLWYIAKQFIQFLCYRKDVHFSEVNLAAPCEDGKHELFAAMYVFGEKPNDIDTKTLKDGRYIKQIHIAGHEGELLSNIADNEIYLRNLPESYATGQHIDAARFVMITAAFEWEFNRLYPDGIPKSTQRLAAETEVTGKLEQLISDSKGKAKEIYKSLLKSVKRSPSLANKIEKIGNDYGEILNAFGRQLYSYNNEELDYSKMGSRLADQRNHFAHGDLDKDFIGLSLLDLIFLERIIYAIQLKICGVDDKNIQKSINELFHCNFAI